jgi:hypothetical protein
MIKPQSSLPCKENSAIVPSSKPTESNPQHHTLFYNILMLFNNDNIWVR